MPKIKLTTCHICSYNLLPNPLYPPAISMYCPDHGDYFVQYLRGEDPQLIFKPFEPDDDNTPIDIEDVGILVKESPIVGRWTYYGRVEPRAGHPGYIVQCDQTGEIFSSTIKAAASLGLSRCALSKHINGKQATVKGFTFTKIGDNIGTLNIQ